MMEKLPRGLNFPRDLTPAMFTSALETRYGFQRVADGVNPYEQLPETLYASPRLGILCSVETSQDREGLHRVTLFYNRVGEGGQATTQMDREVGRWSMLLDSIPERGSIPEWWIHPAQDLKIYLAAFPDLSYPALDPILRERAKRASVLTLNDDPSIRADLLAPPPGMLKREATTGPQLCIDSSSTRVFNVRLDEPQCGRLDSTADNLFIKFPSYSSEQPPDAAHMNFVRMTSAGADSDHYSSFSYHPLAEVLAKVGARAGLSALLTNQALYYFREGKQVSKRDFCLALRDAQDKAIVEEINGRTSALKVGKIEVRHSGIVVPDEVSLRRILMALGGFGDYERVLSEQARTEREKGNLLAAALVENLDLNPANSATREKIEAAATALRTQPESRLYFDFNCGGSICDGTYGRMSAPKTPGTLGILHLGGGGQGPALERRVVASAGVEAQPTGAFAEIFPDEVIPFISAVSLVGLRRIGFVPTEISRNEWTAISAEDGCILRISVSFYASTIERSPDRIISTMAECHRDPHTLHRFELTLEPQNAPLGAAKLQDTMTRVVAAIQER